MIPNSRASKTILQKLRWPLRLVAVGAAGLSLLILLMFNPSWMYAHATEMHGWRVLHDEPLDPAFTQRIVDAQALVQNSEIYDPNWKLQVCLNDGSPYPSIPRTVIGDAFAWGFGNQVVLGCAIHAADDRAEIRGTGYNLTELLAHEAVHCLQYHDLGFWHSRPIADIPVWKWEGYAEYISHRNGRQPDLFTQVETLQQALVTDHQGWIDYTETTGVPLHYAQFHILVRYCMEIEGMTWHQLLADERSEQEIAASIASWRKLQFPH